MRRIALLALLAATGLAACSKDKDVEPPAELVEFRESVAVQRAWTISLGGAKEAQRLGLAPAVAGERAFAAGRDGDVVAIDVATGRTLWRTRTRAPLSAGPGVGEGLVLVGSSVGELIALDALSGERRWTAFVGGELLSAAAVSAEAVVLRTAAGHLVGLSPADGRELWREIQQIPRLTLRGVATPVIAGSTAISGFDNGRVLATEARNGEILWDQLVSASRGRTELERLVDIDSAIKVRGADIFVTTFQGRVAMLALDTGQPWWSREVSSHRGLDVDEDRVYVSTSSGEVLALSRRSGTDLWRQAALRQRRLSAPAVVGPHVVVGDFEGYLHWMDATSGEFVARVRVGGRISNPPAVAGSTLIVQDDEGRVVALRVRN